MTLPTPDAQSPKPLSSQARPAFAAHSTPNGFPSPVTPVMTSASLSSLPLAETDSSPLVAGSHVSAATDFSRPWDLATGGFKTLTAKRELPPQQRRGPISPLPETVPARSYMFLLVIIACIVVMLISGGVVLFMTLQP